MRWIALVFLSLSSPLLADMPKELPKNLKWETNDTDPPLGSPEAKPGGTFHAFILSFPPTLRVVGPDANTGLRGEILGNSLSLATIHPNTGKILPELATQWAFGPDKRSMYFKLDPAAKWSDGKPVTADDYLYTLEYMRSQEITDPWYNDYYSREIEGVVKYDEQTIGVFAPKQRPDLELSLTLSPTPRHFYGKLGKDYVKKYDWAPVPNTGAYQITEVNKGKSVTFTRKEDWWGNDYRYFKHRFNVDKVVFTVIRDQNVASEHFKKGLLSSFFVIQPDLWHNKATGPEFDKGYIHKMWFYTDGPQSAAGFSLNQDFWLFKDHDVIVAFNYAFNIDKVIKTVLRSDYERLDSASIGYGPYTNPKIRARAYDLNKANELLDKAGWKERGPDGIRMKDGKRMSAEINYGQDMMTQRLVIIKEDAKKAGIELILKLMDPTASYKLVQEKKHQISYNQWGTSLRPAYWEFYHSDNAHKPQTNNITNTDNKELDKLTVEYREAIDSETRIKLAHKIQELVHENASFIPTFSVPYFREAYWRYWKVPTPAATKLSESAFDAFSTMYGGLFWFDAEAEKETKAAMKAGKTFPAVTSIDKTFKAKKD